MCGGADVRFRILGPLKVWDGATWAPVPALQRLQVLATSLIDAGQQVSTARLVYEVWGDRPPRTARKTIHAYVDAAAPADRRPRRPRAGHP